jgi:methionyl-tRNA synthetase
VIYVWLDALFNYLSALYINDKEDFWPCNLHIVGKDILQFHAVYWPAFLMALDIPPPKQILAHGWWKNNGEKMSKSLGNVLDPIDVIDEFGRDYLRYFLVREMPIGQDGSFSSDGLIQRINGELINNIGNLVQRVTSFAHKHIGKVVQVETDLNDKDHDLLDTAYSALKLIKDFMGEYKLHDAIGVILDLGHKANGYVEKNAPWKLKNDDLPRMQVVIYVLLEVIKVIGVLLQPFIPDSAEKILGTICDNPHTISFNEIGKKNIFQIHPVEILFKKI